MGVNYLLSSSFSGENQTKHKSAISAVLGSENYIQLNLILFDSPDLSFCIYITYG